MIRPARPADVPEIVALIRELAAYERGLDQVEADEERIAAALFGPEPRVYAHVATADDGPEAGAVVGFAIWFLNFSTWTARHGIYLEDLYVRPHHRRGGHGRALLAELARTAVERGYPRLDWWVLDWNEDAHGFYRSLQAVPMDEWTVWRLAGEPLAALAAATPPPR